MLAPLWRARRVDAHAAHRVPGGRIGVRRSARADVGRLLHHVHLRRGMWCLEMDIPVTGRSRPGQRKSRRYARRLLACARCSSVGELVADSRPVGVGLGDVARDVLLPLLLHVLRVVQIELVVDDRPGLLDRSRRCSLARPPRRSSRHIAAHTSRGRRRTGRGSRRWRSTRWRPSTRARSRCRPRPAVPR